jgi:hypothetical protein
MASKSKFRHQDISVPPRGTKVRTVKAGKHLLRMAFPKGARKRGSGQLVSILHPLKEKNPSCGGALTVADVQALEIPLESLPQFTRSFQGVLEPDEAQNPTDWKGKWDLLRTKVAGWIAPKKPNPSWSESKAVVAVGSDGKRGFSWESNERDAERWAKKWGARHGGTQEVFVIWDASTRVKSQSDWKKIAPDSSQGDLVLRANPCKAKKNLDDIDKAADLAEAFQGSPAEEVREIDLPHKQRDDYAHLGWMAQEVFQPPFDTTKLDSKKVSDDYWRIYKKTGDSIKTWQEVSKLHGATIIVVDVEGDEIELAASADGKQLFFLGGHQSDITKLFNDFKVKNDHDAVDLGNVLALTYIAQKAQAGDTEDIPYVHVFAEEGGTPPRATYDALNKRVLLSGGTYHLNEPERGIIN